MLGLQLVVVNARTGGDLEIAFATFSQQRVGVVLVGDGRGRAPLRQLSLVLPACQGHGSHFATCETHEGRSGS
jgi:hypothetical protein